VTEVDGNAGAREFRVRLEDVFTGPLELLLHLVRENEVEITELSLARVCGDFLAYVRDLAEVDLALAGDYLVVAATLVALKSRTLLPQGEEVELEDELDPADDLVRRLLEYRRVRDAARDLSSRSERRSALFERGVHDMPESAAGEIDLGDVSAYDLLTAFARILRETDGGGDRTHKVGHPERTILEFTRDVAAALRRAPAVSLRELLAERADRGWVIGTFLAILELGKQGALRARQAGPFGEIELERAVADLAEFDRVVAGMGREDAETIDSPPDSTMPFDGVMVPRPLDADGESRRDETHTSG